MDVPNSASSNAHFLEHNCPEKIIAVVIFFETNITDPKKVPQK